MSTSPSILRPEITVPLASGAIVVRDLPWQDSLEFLKRLATHAREIFAAAATPEGKINLQDLLPKLTDVVMNVGELATFLLTKSTGLDETRLKELGTLETLTLLDAALEVNLSEGLIELAKKVAGRVARLMSATTSTSATLPSATS